MKYEHLKTQFKSSKDNYPENLRLRTHRSLSWLEQAEKSDDLDSKFIFLWISFNAIYAKDLLDIRSTDKGSFKSYLQRICQLDKEEEIYHLVWQTFSGSIRLMLDNPYTFQPFWDYHNGIISEKMWQEDFENNKQKALSALKSKDTVHILHAIFNHLYTLRNQIIHGGSTFNSSVNRTQLKDACQILSQLLPAMIQIMLNNADKDWGKPFYPVVD